MNNTTTDNPNQTTMGKNKLRAKLKELEAELATLNEQQKQWVAGEQERFEKRFKEVETAAAAMLDAAVTLVRAVKGT